MQLYLTLHSAVVSKNKNNALMPNIRVHFNLDQLTCGNDTAGVAWESRGIIVTPL